MQVIARRPEVGLLALLLAICLVLPERPGLGDAIDGLTAGAALALPAIALILIYRSNRILNFAQIVVASVVATLMTTLTAGGAEAGRHFGYFPLARAVGSVCSSCVETVPATAEFGTVYVLGRSAYLTTYWLSLVLALLAAVGLSLLCFVVIRRFRKAPRMLVTVATIFLALILAGVRNQVPPRLYNASQRDHPAPLLAVPPPFDWSFSAGSVRISTPAVLTLLATALSTVAVVLYVRRSRAGTAIRAAAENESRAGTLGVDAGAMTMRLWVVAGLLAGVAGVLIAMSVGSPLDRGSALTVGVLVRVLAVVALARLTSIPTALAAAATLGIFQRTIQSSYGSTEPLDGTLLVIIAVALLVQRARARRADIEQAAGWQADREIRPIPRELRSLPVVRSWVRTGSVLLMAVLLGLPWILSAGQAYQASVSFCYAMVGLSLLVLTGWTGQISLGQFAFAGIGAYVAAWSGAPFLLALVVGAVAGGVAALLVGIPALRLRGLQLSSVTLALALTTTSLLINPKYLGAHLPATLDRPSVAGISFADQRLFYYLSLALLVLVTLAVAGMRRSRTARALIAARDNEQAALSFGISVTQARLGAFAASGAIAGFAGVLYSVGQRGVTPADFPPELSITLFLATVLGGFGSIVGPLLGAAYFGILGVVGASETVTFLTSGIGGLALLLFVGGGLSQLAVRGRDGVLRRVADRYGIVVPSLIADIGIGDGQRRRAALQPNVRPGGGSVFVPRRYRLAEQWAIAEPEEESASSSELTGVGSP